MPYINPVLRGWNPDPSLCRVGDDYYLATSTFAYFPGVPIHHSKDLVNWKLIGYALSRSSQLEFRTGVGNEIYAPTLRYHNGRFYVITTDVGGIGNFIVSAEDPAGPWSDPILVDRDLFDPSLLFDTDGTIYYTRRGRNGVVQAEIDVSTGTLLTPLREIARGFCSADAEGPHLYAIQGRYYLLTAEGGSRYGHMATISRSDSPWGPFEPCPHNPILTQRHITFSPLRDTGHAELIEDSGGQWWLFFLATRNYTYASLAHLGRETCCLPVGWTADGWPVLHDNGRAVPLVQGYGPKEIPVVPHIVQDDFCGPSTDAAWFGLRWAPADFVTFGRGDDPALRIPCLPGSLDTSETPAMVARKQTAFDFEASVLVSLMGCSDGDEGGVTLYLDRHHHYDFFLLSATDRTIVILRRRIGDLSAVVFQQELDAGHSQSPVEIRVCGEDKRYTFQYRSTSSEDWKSVGDALTKYLSPEIAESWTGVVIGLYACGSEGSSGNAVFRRFRNEEKAGAWWTLHGEIPESINGKADI